MENCRTADNHIYANIKLTKDVGPKNVPYRQAYAVSVLRQFICNSCLGHWVAVKHILRYLRKIKQFEFIFKLTSTHYCMPM